MISGEKPWRCHKNQDKIKTKNIFFSVCVLFSLEIFHIVQLDEFQVMLGNFFIERSQGLYNGVGVACYEASPLPFLKPRSGLALNSHVDSDMRFFRSDIQSISTSFASNSFPLFSGMVSSGGSLPSIGQSYLFQGPLRQRR